MSLDGGVLVEVKIICKDDHVRRARLLFIVLAAMLAAPTFAGAGEAERTAATAPAARAAAEARQPPSLRLFRAWLAAFNSGDRQRYAKFLKRNFPTWAPLIDHDMGFRDLTGGFDLRKVVGRGSATQVSGWLQERDSDQFASFSIYVSTAKRPKILSLTLAAIPRPAAFPIARLTENQVVSGVGALLRKKSRRGPVQRRGARREGRQVRLQRGLRPGRSRTRRSRTRSTRGSASAR